MSVPQDSKARRVEKKRRTKKLAKWREKQAAEGSATAAATTPKKKG
jgi:hypothetical protein